MNKRQDLEMMDALVLLVLVMDKPATIKLVAEKVEELCEADQLDVVVHPKRVRSCIDECERLGLVRWTRMRHPETDRDKILEYADKRLHFPVTGAIYKKIYVSLRKASLHERYGTVGDIIADLIPGEVTHERR